MQRVKINLTKSSSAAERTRRRRIKDRNNKRKIIYPFSKIRLCNKICNYFPMKTPKKSDSPVSLLADW